MLLLCHVTHPSHSPNTHSRATPPTHPLITLSLPLFATPPSYYPLLSLLPLILIPRQVDGVHRTLPNHRTLSTPPPLLPPPPPPIIIPSHYPPLSLTSPIIIHPPPPLSRQVDGVHRTLPNHRHVAEETKGVDKLAVLANIMERHKLKVHLYLGLLCTLSIVLWSWPISWKDTNSR